MILGFVSVHQTEEIESVETSRWTFFFFFKSRPSHNGGFVMVRAGISMCACIELVFIDGGSLASHRYIEEVLADHVGPIAPFIGQFCLNVG